MTDKINYKVAYEALKTTVELLAPELKDQLRKAVEIGERAYELDAKEANIQRQEQESIKHLQMLADKPEYAENLFAIGALGRVTNEKEPTQQDYIDTLNDLFNNDIKGR